MDKQWVEVAVVEKENCAEYSCANGCQRSSGSPTGG